MGCGVQAGREQVITGSLPLETLRTAAVVGRSDVICRSRRCSAGFRVFTGGCKPRPLMFNLRKLSYLIGGFLYTNKIAGRAHIAVLVCDFVRFCTLSLQRPVVVISYPPI